MKRFLALLTTLFVILVAIPATATTTVTPADPYTKGGFIIIDLTLTADGSGGAVTDEEIDLSFLYTHTYPTTGKKSWYFYMVKTVPGTGAAAPDAYTIVLQDPASYSADNGSVCSISARSTSDVEYADAAEDLPNYWPVVENLYLTVSDIGASNSTVIKLIFLN